MVSFVASVSVPFVDEPCRHADSSKIREGVGRIQALAYRSLGYAQFLCRRCLAERSFRHHAVQAFPCDLALAFGPSLADNPGQGQKGIYGIIETIISGVYANGSVPLTRNAVKAFVRSHQIHAFPGSMECLSVRTYRHVRIYVRAHAAYSESGV